MTALTLQQEFEQAGYKYNKDSSLAKGVYASEINRQDKAHKETVEILEQDHEKSMQRLNAAYGKQENEFHQAYAVKLVEIGHRYLKENDLMPQSGSDFSDLIKDMGNLYFDNDKEYKQEIKAMAAYGDAVMNQKAKLHSQMKVKGNAIAFAPAAVSTVTAVLGFFNMVPKDVTTVCGALASPLGLLGLFVKIRFPNLFQENSKQKIDKLTADEERFRRETGNLVDEKRRLPLVENIVNAFVNNDPGMLTNSEYSLDKLNHQAIAMLERKLPPVVAQPA